MRAFAELLRRHRAAAGLTQEELAERAGLSPRGVLYLERAGRRPYRDTVRRLADALLLTEEDRAAFVSVARRLRSAGSTEAGPSAPDDDQELTEKSWVYVAHAQDDAASVEWLCTDLGRQGITVWVDEHDLSPGTPNWEQTLRDAIRAASALVLISSPHTRTSRYISDELRIAELYERRVYPFWVAGERWMECIPLGWGGLQYLDARGDRYAGALALLATELRQLPGQSERLAPPAAWPLATTRNPYKGLRPFTTDDAGDFFGRDALIDALLAALPADPAAAPRFLALVGASGSGKSSAVCAGLLPRLRAGALSGSEEWIYLAPMVPGARPLDALAGNLARALPNGDPTVIRAALDDSPQALDEITRRLVAGPRQCAVLVVDQGEELFATACREEERRQFIDLLTTACSMPDGPTLVILTFRADFYDRPLRYPALGTLVHAHSVVTLPPTVGDLRRAIEGPAALPDVQLSFDDDLIGDMLFDVRGQSGALPLLQFTLDQLFARRDGGRLTGAAYRAMGGVRGALARHAEATYTALPDEEHRRLTHALFSRLIDPGMTEQDTTRRRVKMTELELPDPAETERLKAVVDAFIAARLLVVSRLHVTPANDGPETTIEVSHEALIREWARLGEWLHTAREDIRRQQTIGADAAAWLQRGRPADHLYRGSLLLEAEEWALRNVPNTQEAAFLEAARAERQRREQEEHALQTKQLTLARRAATRLRSLVVVLALCLLAAAGLTALALTNAHQAQLARRRALVSARQELVARQQAVVARSVALSRQLAAQAITRYGSQYDLALLLSLEARRAADTVEARAGLLQGMEAEPPGLIALLSGHILGVNSVAMTHDSAILASGSEDGTIRLWDVRRRRVLGPPLKANAGPIWGVAFSPDGKLLASGDDNGTVRLWDVARRLPLGPPVFAHTGPATPLAFSPDGKTLASAGDDGSVMIWDVSPSGSLTDPTAVDGCPDTDGAQIWALAISAGGNRLANGCTDGTIQLWQVQGTTLTSPATLTGHIGPVFGVAFSPNGKTLASAGGDHTVRLWDVTRQREIGGPLTGHTDTVFSVAFSPDGSTLASGGLDALRLWDMRSHRPLGPPLESHTGDANSVVFSPDGATLAAGTADGSVALWDVRDRLPPSTALDNRLGQMSNVFVSPDGKTMASVSPDGTLLRVWALAGGTLSQPESTISVGAQVSSVAFSPDSRLLAVGEGTGGIVQLWEAASGRPFAKPIATQGSGIHQVASSPDGKVLAAAGDDGTIQLWSVAIRPPGFLRPLGAPLAGSPAAVLALAFSPDGKLLAAGGADGLIRLWNVARRRPLGLPLVGHLSGVTAVAFSPDGKLLASASDDRTVRLWDVARRRPLGPPLIGHTDVVLDVAFSRDGTILASGSTAPGVRLWDVASGQPLGAPLGTGHSGFIDSMAFTAGGTTLVAGSGDGSILVWNIDLATWPGRACRIANRNLTHQEWRQYLGDEPYHSTCPGLPAGS